MNKYIPYKEFSYVADLLTSQKWVFAKTMPENPHWYCLRRNMGDDGLFDYIVNYMRKYGYSGEFQGRTYTYFDVNEHIYWTMGDPIRETILINRKVRPGVIYDEIADNYDQIFSNAESHEEDDKVVKLIAYQKGTVLDVGCGTGLFSPLLNAKRYIGIDISLGMINHAREKYRSYVAVPGHGPTSQAIAKDVMAKNHFVHSSLEAYFCHDEKFDVIISTYGSPSYITPEYLKKIPELLSPEGRYFLMFYKDDYIPVTYLETGIFSHWNKGNFDKIPGEKSEFHNYIVVRGDK